jgi:hypothetical protein
MARSRRTKGCETVVRRNELLSLLPITNLAAYFHLAPRIATPAEISARRTVVGETPNSSPSWAKVVPERYSSAAP